MTTRQVRKPWTLVEYVGGPNDSELLATTANANHLHDGYLSRSNPSHVAALTGWQQALERATATFGRGVPDRHLRMIWEGQDTPRAAFDAHGIKARTASQVDRLRQALRSGEDYEARLIAAAFCAHTPSKTTLIESLLAPTMRILGDLWADGTDRMYVQHRAAAIVHGILGDHSATSTQIGGHRAVVATVTGELHSLPARMAAVALREDGWQVEEVSGALPPRELANAAAERGIDLVVLSTTMAKALPAANQVQRLLEPVAIPVFVGVPGQSLSELQRLARRVSVAAAN